MHEHKSTTRFDFKAQFDTAANLGALCARLEWYGPPLPTDPTQSTLLGSDLFIDGQIIRKIEETFHFADIHPGNNQLDQVMIYIFDGRGVSSKFHAHLWTPIMGHKLLPFEYFKPKDPNPYLPYVMEALWTQSGPVKVTAIVNRAFAAVRNSEEAGLPRSLPPEAHKLLLRDTLMRLRHTDPFIYFKPSGRVKQPHVDREALVGHLGAYDLDPTWDATQAVVGRL